MNKNTIKKIIASGLIIAIIAAGTEIADKSSQVAGTNSINTIVGAEEITRLATDFEKERPTITSVINNKNSTTIKWNKIEGAKGYDIYRDGEKICQVKKSIQYTDKKANKNGSSVSYTHLDVYKRQVNRRTYC